MTAILVAVVCATAGTVAFAEYSGPGEREFQSRFNTPEARARAGAARAREEARLARRDAPTARAERARSRLAYRDLSGREALDLALEKHGPILRVPAWRPPQFLNGERIVEYRGDHTAVIDNGPDQPRGLLHSLLPLRSSVETGALSPVDVALRRDSDRYVPKNPLVAMELPGDATGAVTFKDSALSIQAVGAVASPASETTGKLFYPNIRRDTDLVFAPDPAGVEALWQIRSAEGSERHGLRFSRAGGLELLPVYAPGSAEEIDAIEIKSGGDALAAVVAPPRAWDADGATVPARYELAGDELTVVVDHQGGDWAYPIMVDPYITELYSWHGSGTDTSGWWYSEEWPGKPGRIDGYLGDSPWKFGWGLYAKARTGTRYERGEYGQWSWQAGEGSFIYRVDFGPAAHQNGFNDFNVHQDNFMGESLWDNDGGPFGAFEPGIWTGGTWFEDEPNRGLSPSNDYGNFTWDYKNHCLLPTCGPSIEGNPAGHSGNIASFGLYMDFPPGNPIGSPAPYMTMRSIYLYVSDVGDPELSGSAVQPPDGWVDSTTISFQGVEASDTGLRSRFTGVGTPIAATGPHVSPSPGGLGMKRIRVYDKNSTLLELSHPCTGDRSSPCPNSLAPANNRFDVSTASMGEGVRPVSVAAYDAVQNESIRSTATVKVDHSPPSLTLSGNLAAGGTISDSQAYELVVDARDGTHQSPRSGVAQIDVNIDGQPAFASRAQDCDPTNGCVWRAIERYVVNPYEYSAGSHTLTVTATDQLGHSQSTNVTFSVTQTAATSPPIDETTLNPAFNFIRQEGIPDPVDSTLPPEPLTAYEPTKRDTYASLPFWVRDNAWVKEFLHPYGVTLYDSLADPLINGLWADGITLTDLVFYNTGAVVMTGDSAANAKCERGTTCLWEHSDYRGRRLVWSEFEGTGNVVANLGDYGFDNAISSWMNRTNTDATFFENAGFSGQTYCLDQNSRSPRMGLWTDRASSFSYPNTGAACGF